MNTLTSRCTALLTIALACALAAPASATTKKYDIKSATITYTQTTQAGTMKTERKHVFTFDDYGAKEREDVYTNDVISQTTINTGSSVLMIMHASKEAYQLGTEVKLFDYTYGWNALPDSEKVNGTAREFPPFTVAGKVCASYQRAINALGGSTTIAGWNGICLLRDARSDNSSNVLRALTVEENPMLAPSMFSVPEGYKLTKP